MPLLVEVCVDSMDSVRAAVRGGADRLELCAALSEGGLTPGAGFIQECRQQFRIPIHVMIRPRGGDFVYNWDDLRVMEREIVLARGSGAEGVVFGLLRHDGSLDRARTAHLVALARPLSVTFHRAIDAARDPVRTVAVLAELGVDRVLTSGGAETAARGWPTIARMVKAAGDRLVVMAGSGLNGRNVPALVRRTGVREVHLSGSVRRAGRSITEAGRIRSVVQALARGPTS